MATVSVQMHTVTLPTKLVIIDAIEVGDQSKSSAQAVKIAQELLTFTVYYLEARNEAGTDLEVIIE